MKLYGTHCKPVVSQDPTSNEKLSNLATIAVPQVITTALGVLTATEKKSENNRTAWEAL